MGALNSTLTFELETLSQYRHLIERLQDEIFVERSHIEEQRNSLEIMQSRMDQMERSHQQPSSPTSTQGASKNVPSATVNQIPDLNEPFPDPIWEQHGQSKIKKNQVSEFLKFKCHVLFYIIYKRESSIDCILRDTVDMT
jgi:hypothetical protein